MDQDNKPKKRILIIEDDFFIRDLYVRQFTKEGFAVDTAENGNDGIVKAEDQKPDAILLDIMLPKVSGLEVLKKLKSNSQTKASLVVLLTNLSEDDTIKQGFELGAEGYLIKSAYTPEQVVKEVGKLIGVV